MIALSMTIRDLRVLKVSTKNIQKPKLVEGALEKWRPTSLCSYLHWAKHWTSWRGLMPWASPPQRKKLMAQQTGDKLLIAVVFKA